MKYSFKSGLIKNGNRAYIMIPFNVWETCKQKGLVPVEVEIEGNSFECKLVPKGNGNYCIPIVKDVYNKIYSSAELDVQFKVISGLSRINSNSPYSRENPVRKIDSINYIKQIGTGLCGQACIAMLTGLQIDEVVKIMKSRRGEASTSKVIETLDYFGFVHNKPIYTKGRKVELPKCCIINTKGHFLVYYDGKYYDSTYGILQDYLFENITSYIEIGTEN